MDKADQTKHQARLTGEEKELIRRDAAVSVSQANSTPAVLAVRRAAGVWLEDHDGRRYIDFYGNNCHHVGHSHPRVVDAIIKQLNEVAFVSRGQTNRPAIELAELIRANYPTPDARIMFMPGGSEAVEAAIMVAKAHTRRYKTLSFYDSYHGRSAGALSVSGRYRDRTDRLGPLMPGAIHVPAFFHWPEHDPDERAKRCIESVKAAFEYERDIAAFVAEPVRTGPTGPFVPPSWFWPEIRDLCDKQGTLLIFDDIPGGLGKTGHLFNQTLVGARPDITLLGKSLGGGIVPLAAVILNPELNTTSDLNIGYFTHEKNPTAAAAGLATLGLIIESGLPSHVLSLEGRICAFLLKLLDESDFLGGVRSCGFLFSIDCVDPLTKRPSHSCAEALFKAVLDQGLLPLPLAGASISFSVPLITTADELESAFDRLRAAVRKTGKQ